MITEQHYTQAESGLYEVAEKYAIYSAAIKSDMKAVEISFGKESGFLRALTWIQEAAEKYKPVFIALVDFFREMRPLVIKDGKVTMPAKFAVWSWLKIGWAAGKLIVKLIKIL